MYKAINGWTKAKILKVMQARRYNCAATTKYDKCAYATSNGNRCAVGLFIPKGHKGISVEDDVYGLLNEWPDLKIKMPLELLALKELQQVHDNMFNRDNAKQAMIDWVKKNVK